MWELIATAAVALNAGAGLQAAIGGGPSAGDANFARFAGRSRLINLMLTTIGTAAAAATYYDERRGNLWLYAACGTFLGIPFNLLMMAPPTPIMQPASRLEPPPSAYRRPMSPAAVHPAAEQLRKEAGGTHTPDDVGSEGSAFAVAAGYEDVGGGGGGGSVSFAPEVDAYGSSYGNAGAPPSRRLMYAKSGVLVDPSSFASSWTRKFWFSTCLSCGVMLALLDTRKDAATYNAPF